MKRKLCNLCGEVKNISEFNNHWKAKDGYYTYCKKCGVEKVKRKYDDGDVVNPTACAKARAIRDRIYNGGKPLTVSDVITNDGHRETYQLPQEAY